MRISIRDGVVTVASVVAVPGEAVIGEILAGRDAVRGGVSEWELGATYTEDDVVQRGGKLWRAIPATHTANAPDWAPGIAWSLWAETWATGVIPVWRQPLGSHDAYPREFAVWYPDEAGTVYYSTINANVWSPVAYPQGWSTEPVE